MSSAFVWKAGGKESIKREKHAYEGESLVLYWPLYMAQLMLLSPIEGNMCDK